MVDLTLSGLSSSSLISPQLRQIHHMEDKQCKLCFFFWRAVVWQSPPSHVNWGDMKDVLHEVNKYQRDPSLLFLVSPSGPFLSFYLFKWWRKGGDSERIVYASQLETDRTFYNPQCPACEKMQ